MTSTSSEHQLEIPPSQQASQQSGQQASQQASQQSGLDSGRGPLVLRDLPVDAVTTADHGTDLRGGAWTRFGSSSVRGDRATEGTLRGLAEQSRDVARAQGFAAGWAEGRRAALAASERHEEERARAFAEHSALVLAAQHSAADALLTATGRLERTIADVQHEIAAQAVELALQIAEALLARELAACDDAGADACRRALAGVPLDVPVTVRLHPDDLAGLDQAALAAFAGDRVATFLADPGLAHGDALVETETGSVDAGLAAALDRVREVLA